MKKVIKIMFVCHGNICRSPMAEFIFKDLAQKRNLTQNFYVKSSATSREEIWEGIGNPVYPPARCELEKHGISCGSKRAVQLTANDYDEYDMFIGMDSANIRNMKRIFDGDIVGKIYKMMSFADSERDVDDPWYSRNFEKTYSDIFTACNCLLDYCIKNYIL